MAEDDVLRGVRAAREAYARSLGYDVQAMVADLRARDTAGDWPVVRRAPRRPSPSHGPTAAPNEGAETEGGRASGLEVAVRQAAAAQHE
jgi:hypothetical protein